MINQLAVHALYTPSLSREFAEIGFGRHLKRSFDFPDSDLNFLSPQSGLFHYPYALYSAGQAAKTTAAAAANNSVKSRNKNATTVIGDSGGFQIQGGRIKFTGDETCERMLRWLEGHTDFSMSLDFPTGGISSGNVAIHRERLISAGHNIQAMSAANGLSLDYNACLKQSLLNLDYFQKNRVAGATDFLNVVQGRNEQESSVWYEAVKGYGFEGWAFAGAHRTSFSMLLNRLLDMHRDGLLQDVRWVHVLGISTPSVAYALNALQTAVRQTYPNIQFSFDTAGPFISAAKFQALMTHRLDKNGWSFQTVSMAKEGRPTDHRTLNELAWEIAQRPRSSRSARKGDDDAYRKSIPIGTNVGARVKISEICVGSNGSSDLDADSVYVLMNHNAEAYLRVFAQVNRIFDNPREFETDIPAPLKGLRMGIEEVWSGPSSKLQEWSGFLDALTAA